MSFGLRRRGEQSFRAARNGFVRLGAPCEIALVSLDLAAEYRCTRGWELEDLAADTFRRFCELCGDFEAIAALSLWLEAVRARHNLATVLPESVKAANAIAVLHNIFTYAAAKDVAKESRRKFAWKNSLKPFIKART